MFLTSLEAWTAVPIDCIGGLSRPGGGSGENSISSHSSLQSRVSDAILFEKIEPFKREA
jgi:hypothetical protein